MHRLKLPVRLLHRGLEDAFQGCGRNVLEAVERVETDDPLADLSILENACVAKCPLRIFRNFKSEITRRVTKRREEAHEYTRNASGLRRSEACRAVHFQGSQLFGADSQGSQLFGADSRSRCVGFAEVRFSCCD